MNHVTIRHDGRPLTGTVRLDGGKHAFAHSLACAALADRVRLTDVPGHIDAVALREALTLTFDHVRYDRERRELELAEPRQRDRVVLDAGLSARSRSLFCLLPALLTRARQVRLEAPPRGCQVGDRPADWYLATMRQFGVVAESEGSAVVLSWPRRRPANIEFAYPTMTGTVIAVAAAAATRGVSTIRNASVEPSCGEQVGCLRAMGARVSGDLPELTIRGAPGYPVADWRVAPDRIHAATFLIGGLLTRGRVTVTGSGPLRVPMLVRFLREAGADVLDEGSRITAGFPARGELAGVDLAAGSEPLFSSDWAPFAALLLATRSKGASRISDNVFPGRFQFAGNLIAKGLTGVELRPATVGGRSAIVAMIDGRPDTVLRGGELGFCPDIRGSAALLLAGLVADGPCRLPDDFHVRRGYTDLPAALRSLGAGSAMEVRAA